MKVNYHSVKRTVEILKNLKSIINDIDFGVPACVRKAGKKAAAESPLRFEYGEWWEDECMFALELWAAVIENRDPDWIEWHEKAKRQRVIAVVDNWIRSRQQFTDVYSSLGQLIHYLEEMVPVEFENAQPKLEIAKGTKNADQVIQLLNMSVSNPRHPS